MSLFKRKAEGNLRDKKRRPYEDGDRDWSVVATSQGISGASKGGFSPRALVGSVALPTP